MIFNRLWNISWELWPKGVLDVTQNCTKDLGCAVYPFITITPSPFWPKAIIPFRVPSMGYVGCLVVWVLWHISLCRLFNAKSIFRGIISSISNNLVQHKYRLMSKTVLFQIIQYSINMQFKYQNSSITKTVWFQTIQFSISIQFSSI